MTNQGNMTQRFQVAVTATSMLKSAELVGIATKAFSGHELKLAPLDVDFSVPEQLIAFSQSADLIIVGREEFSASVLDQLPKLKAISKYGVGLDNLNLQAMAKNGVKLLHAKGVNAFPVAEHAIGLILMHLRRLDASATDLRRGIWSKNGGRSLSECQIGIVGCGAVGKELARLLRVFGAKVVAVDIEDRRAFLESIDGEQIEYDELLKTSDAISYHVPLTSLTRNMFSLSSLSMVKKGAFIVNCSRGEVIDENALLLGIRSEVLGGAGLDVFVGEPFPNPEILKNPKIISTPHTAGNSNYAVLSMGNAAIDNAVRFIAESTDK